MFSRHICVCLLLVLSNICFPKAASAANGGESFTAGFSDVRIRVFDLTPDDGRPAAYQLGNTTTEMHAGIASASGLPTLGSDQTVTDNRPFTLRLDGYGLNTTLYTGSGLSDAGLIYELPARPVEASAFRLELLQVTPVVLEPHSLLVIDGMINRSTVDLHPYDYIYLRLNGELTGVSGTDFWICCEAPPGALARPFQFAYANTGDDPLSLSMKLNLLTEVTVAVPEPSGSAMLLAGLAMLGIWRWRRAARALLGHVGQCAAVLSLCGAAGTAMAQSASDPYLTARLSNVALTVVDIEPDDGIAAAFRINQENVGMANAVWWPGGGDGPREDLAPPIGTAARSNIDFRAWRSTIETNGSRGDAQASIIWDAQVPLESYFYYSISNEYGYTANLTLRPGTALVLSGTLSQQYVPRGMHPYDLVQSFFTAEMSNEYVASRYSSSLDKYGPDTIQEWDQTVDFSLAITNPDQVDRAVDLRVRLFSGMLPRLPLAPVPEPSTYALLLAGLLVLRHYSGNRPDLGRRSRGL